ncbi:MAG TPA: tetratricopeptide repeat protein [Burkholderiales bacterium]|nr:tetratricopeptide repeat protein [Burkholderiales bacterium]
MDTLNAAVQQGLLLHQQGRVAEAMAIYEQVLRNAPEHPDALHYLGVACRQTGRTAQALDLLARAVRARPDAPMAHNNLGNARLALGQLEEALGCFNRAIELAPAYAGAHNNRGGVLVRLNRPEEALAAFRRVAELEPAGADPWYNMGVVLQELGRLDEAADCYRQAIDRAPAFFEARINQASVLIRQKRFEEALAAGQQALGRHPQSAEAHHNWGLALAGLERPREALQAQQEALRLRPDYAQAWLACGDAHCDLAETLPDPAGLDEACACYQQALALRPGFADAHCNWGIAEGRRGRPEAAALHYRQALEIQQDHAQARGNLGATLLELGRPEEALDWSLRALALRPDFADSQVVCGNASQLLGRPREALRHYEQALALKPDFALADSNRLFVLAYNELGGAGEYLDAARGWERRALTQAERRAASTRIFHNGPAAGRRLRVGYVSGDFCQHAVSYFIERLFAAHDRSRVEICAYYTHDLEDEVTARLRALVERWTSLAGLSDAAARERIEADGVDVLIDLSGHTAHARLGVFARRAAPVQAHYIGYFASTGLTEMDYWIGDAVVTPKAADADFSEHLWRLPRVWMCYDGKADAPAVDWRPAEDGTLRLGSFNSLRKLSPQTLALWARILCALPQGRLLLKTKELAQAENRERILRCMQEAGVAPERIELLDGSTTPDWASHMACYNRLDIALDPIGGMAGATTTCDAIWMAVPVVTLAGGRMASRAAASLLTAAGHAEWIASDEADYLAKVVALARDAGGRAALRPAARGQMAQSALCDVAGLARGLEHAYAEMFGRWQEGRRAAPPSAPSPGPAAAG